MDGLDPAEGGAPNAESTQAATPTVHAEDVSPVQPGSTGETRPAAAPATKPDPRTLISDPEVRQAILKDPEFRRELFRHPETQSEMEHRIASEVGRRARAEREHWEQQQQREASLQREEAEIAQLENMDELDVGTLTKQQLTERKQRVAQARAQGVMQAQLEPLLREREMANLGQLGQRAYRKLAALATQAGLAEKDLGFLDPMKYGEYEDYIEGAVNALAEAIGEKKVKAKLPVEKQAWLEEQSAKARGGTRGPEVLPLGEGTASYTRAQLAEMSPEEYRRNRDRVWEQLSRR